MATAVITYSRPWGIGSVSGGQRWSATLDSDGTPRIVRTPYTRLARWTDALLLVLAMCTWTTLPLVVSRSLWTRVFGLFDGSSLQPFLMTLLVEWTAGVGLWCAPLILGFGLRASASGRRWLAWHGAEHTAWTGHLVTADCGVMMHARAAAWFTAVMVGLAIGLAIFAPEVRESWLSWARLPAGLGVGTAAVWSRGSRHLTLGGVWLQRMLVSQPTTAQLTAAYALKRASLSACRLSFSAAAVTPAAARE